MPYFSYQDTSEYNKIISLCFQADPIQTIYNLHGLKHVDQALFYATKVLESDLNIKTQSDALVYKIKALFGLYHDDECRELINTYLKKPEFYTAITKAITEINISELYAYEELQNIFAELNIEIIIASKPSFDMKQIEELDIKEIVNSGWVKEVLSFCISTNNLEKIAQILDYSLVHKFNTKIFLSHILDNIDLAESSEEVDQIFKILDTKFKKDQSAKQKIDSARELRQELNKIALDQEPQKQTETISEKEVKDDAIESVEVKPKDTEKAESIELLEVKTNESIDIESLVNEAENYLEERKTKEVITQQDTNPYTAIHKAHQLQKKLLQEKTSQVTNYNQSWIVSGSKFVYSQRMTQEKLDAIPTTKITTSFGSSLYVSINSGLNLGSNKTKFDSALDHWAGAFYNKSGVKGIFGGGKAYGYELKIMSSDERLFANKVYVNESGAKLVIFDQLVDHDYIEKYSTEIETLYAGSDSKVMGDHTEF